MLAITTPTLLIAGKILSFASIFLLAEMDIDSAAKLLGVFTSLLFLVGFFVAIVYYFWKQKSYDTLLKEKAELESSLKNCREDRAELEKKMAAKTAEVAGIRLKYEKVKEKRRLDRKLIHQQAGKIAGMNLPEEHFFDDEDAEDL